MDINPAPLALIGPTATGKSVLALRLADRLSGEIVNVDAFVQYRGMNIGTAKPSWDERNGIPHHQIDVLDVTDVASVAKYKERASCDINSICQRGKVPIVVGGSMMYIQALFDNWDLPATDADVRHYFENQLKSLGSHALHRQLADVDPAAAQHLLPTDGRRIVRALEVITITGKPFRASAPEKGAPQWGSVLVGLDCDTEKLDQRIAQRTEHMFSNGLVQEVQGLLELGLREGVTASRAIGYAQVIAALDGEYSLEHAQELTLIGTRRYVRRQRSWFKRDARLRWFDVYDSDVVEGIVGYYNSMRGNSIRGAAAQLDRLTEIVET